MLLQFSWTTLAQTATGITSILGLLGFIYFIILRLTEKSSSIRFTPELINEIKKSSLDLETIKSLDIDKLKAVLENENNVSSLLVKDGIIKEFSQKAKVVLVVSSMLVISALLLGLIWKNSEKTNYFSYNGLVVDDESDDPIPNAIIGIKNDPTFDIVNSDSRGLFKISLPINETFLFIEHPEFENFSLHKSFISNSSSDTIRLIRKQKLISSTISGIIVNEGGEKIESASIFTPFGGNSSFSDSNGYFVIEVLYNTNDSPTLSVEKDGYETWRNYIDPKINNIEVILRK